MARLCFCRLGLGWTTIPAPCSTGSPPDGPLRRQSQTTSPPASKHPIPQFQIFLHSLLTRGGGCVQIRRDGKNKKKQKTDFRLPAGPQLLNQSKQSESKPKPKSAALPPDICPVRFRFGHGDWFALLALVSRPGDPHHPHTQTNCHSIRGPLAMAKSLPAQHCIWKQQRTKLTDAFELDAAQQNASTERGTR